MFALAEDTVHSVVNPIPRLTGSIHIYGGGSFGQERSEWDPESLSERPFGLEAARGAFAEGET